MAAANSTHTIFPPSTSALLILWATRGLEFLWLGAILIIPLVAVSRGYLVSEVVTGEAAVLKIAALRVLVALMVILWAVEWSLNRGYALGTASHFPSLQPARWLSRSIHWVKRCPTRWVALAAVFFTASILLTTVLSASVPVSVWGAVPGQDGYSTYTMLSYVLLFALVATHLKTNSQLSRLLRVIVLMGVLFAGFAVIQHYGDDPFALLEPAGAIRETSTAGNPIFAAAVMLMTITISLVMATAALNEPQGTRRFWLNLAPWVPIMTVQCLGMLFTLSRGPWMGTALSLVLVLGLIGFFLGRRVLLRVALVLALTGLITTIAVQLPNGDADDEAGVVVAERFASISSQVGGGGMSGRLEIWKTSWLLSRYHPWPASESLGLYWLRPLIGYGPDLYRYVYFLESVPKGDDLSLPEAHHAHNYFINQAVEQGILGLLGSLGIVLAVTVAGTFLLLRQAQEFSLTHKLVLIGLISLVAGRALEQMVGVGRVSDLTIAWILLGVFMALPTIAHTSKLELAKQPFHGGSTPRRRANQRLGNQMRIGSLSGTDRGPYRWLRMGVWTVLIASLTLGIGVFSWFKAVSYPLAAREVARARDYISQGDAQASLASLSRAITLAPDVPTYYKYQASVYSEHIELKDTGILPREPECSFQESVKQVSYERCLTDKIYQVRVQAIQPRPLYIRSRMALAKTALNLALDDPESYPPSEAIRLYSGAVQLAPNDWRNLNQLAFAYLRFGESEKAMEPLIASLAITGDHVFSAYALYLKGGVHINIGEPEIGADYIERALALNDTGSWAGDARESLVRARNPLGNLESGKSTTPGADPSR